MDCKGCVWEGCDTMSCQVHKLHGAWNDLMKETPILRMFTEDYECPDREERDMQNGKRK